MFSPGSIDHAATWAQDNEARAVRTFAVAIKLRQMLFGIFTAIGTAAACDRRDFLIFRTALAHAPQRCHLVPMQRRFAWSIARTRNPIRDAMMPVLWSAADLMLEAAAIRSGVAPTRNVCGCFSTRARQTPAAGATWARAEIALSRVSIILEPLHPAAVPETLDNNANGRRPDCPCPGASGSRAAR